MGDGGHEYAKKQVRHRHEGKISIGLADETTSAKVALYSNTGREADGEVQARVGHRLERVCPLEWKKIGSLKSPEMRPLKSCTSPGPALSGPRS